MGCEGEAVIDLLQRGDIAVDCGANLGNVTAQMAARGATVYSFEPNPHAFRILSKRFSHNRSVHCINKGVFDRDGSFPLYLHKDVRTKHDGVALSESSSMLASKEIVDVANCVVVEVIDLASFIEHLNANVRVLKMDIEGLECVVINKLIDSRMINKIDYLLAETHEKQIPSIREETREMKDRITRLGLGDKIRLDWI